MSQATDEIKLKLDLIDLLSEYISLRPAGANYKAVCPFHSEKTPSFMASREKQIWHCFGCSEGGDIFGFVMKMEGLEFPEALRLLAQKAGVKLTDYYNEVNMSERNRLLDILSLAAKFYHKVLLDSSAAAPARDYLKKRGLTDDSIEEWQIGFIPSDWDALTKFFLKRGTGINDLLSAGLTIKKESGGWYDRFRGRIMFPIWDVNDNVVGFTGRLLDEGDGTAGKYVNSPQSSVFDKGKISYGLNKAKQEIKKQDRVICVEGQMDVIACHQAGQKNTVATSGTALTAEQIKLIKRFTNNVFLSFDMDAAGQNAARRGIDLGLREGLNIKVIALPPPAGKDPDECLKNNPALWFKAVEEARHIMDFIFSQALKGKNLKDPADISAVGKNVLTQIAKINDSLEQDFWLKKLAGLLKISETVIYEKFKSIKNDVMAPGSSRFSQNGEKIIVNPDAKTKPEILSEQILALIIARPNLRPTVFAQLKVEALAPTNLTNLYKQLIHSQDVQNESDANSQIIDRLELLGTKLLSEAPTAKILELTLDLVRNLNEWYNKERRRELEKLMQEAEKITDQETVNQLLSQFRELI